MEQMKTLGELETLTKKYAEARLVLSDLVGALNVKIDALKREAMPELKRAVAKTADRYAELAAGIDTSRELFVKPRTYVWHGVKIGVEKGKGKIELEDEDRTMKLIRKHLAEQADVLIKHEEYVSKSALKNLTVAELKSIGCTVEETDDQVVIRATDREVDKLVNALLKSAIDEETAAAAA